MLLMSRYAAPLSNEHALICWLQRESLRIARQLASSRGPVTALVSVRAFF